MSETYETLEQFSDRYWNRVRRSPEFIHRAAGHRLYQIEQVSMSPGGLSPQTDAKGKPCRGRIAENDQAAANPMASGRRLQLSIEASERERAKLHYAISSGKVWGL